MKIFCLIPARGGSKGVPQKNIRSFLGQPLITHSIKYALNAKAVSGVYVSTDNSRIAEISMAAGADVIPRPADIAGDDASTESAISHALTWWKDNGISPDIIVLLQATSPLRPRGSLEQALDHFQQSNFDSLLSISPTHRFFWKLDGQTAQAEYDYLNRPRRQAMTTADIRHMENGSLYIFSRKHFEHIGNRLGGKIGYTTFSEEYSLEIDTELDFQLLENVANKLE